MFNDKVLVHTPDYSKHDLSFNSLVTSNFGELNVVLSKHGFAGESFRCSIEHLLKFQPFLAPVFQRYTVRFDSFVIPDNLIWKDALKFYKGGKDGMTDLPAPNANPWYLYFYVVMHQLYSRGISDNVLNPFSGSLIDLLNLPTFDRELSDISALSDAELLSACKFEIGYPATGADNLNSVFAGNVNNGICYLPFVTLNSTYRIIAIRSLFLCRLFGKTLAGDYATGATDSLLWRLHTAVKPKDITLIPFLDYQLLWREYYRNQFVDDNEFDSSIVAAEYLPEDIDVMDILKEFSPTASVLGIPTMSAYSGNPNIASMPWCTADSDKSSTGYSFGFEAAHRIPGISASYLSNLYKTSVNWSNFGTFLSNTIGKRDANFTKDYFTSASLTAQAESSVHIPVDSGQIRVNGMDLFSGAAYTAQVTGAGTSGLPTGTIITAGNVGNIARVTDTALGTIPMLREANVFQQMLEKIALAGNRDYEWYQIFFGHRPSDARLKRPDFLGRVKSGVSISEVTQTSESSLGKPLGDVSGKGASYNGEFLFEYLLDEPSWVIVIMSILPKQSYFQGLPRELCKVDRFDYLLPDFQTVGMQAIDNTELLLSYDERSSSALEGVFGYTDKYNEYRSSQDQIHSEFRNSMLYWTSNRMFANSPSLNKDFIRARSSDSDLYRPFAVTDGYTSHVIGELHFNLQVSRPLSIYPHYSL